MAADTTYPPKFAQRRPDGSIHIPTGGTLEVESGGTCAIDSGAAFTIGGLSVGAHQYLVDQTIAKDSAKVIYNSFVAKRSYQVTEISYTPDVAQGGALTATPVKATGTATPASATTPLATAASIDLNGTAHTVQVIALTATAADLLLAAGDRIAIVLSGAMTTGSGLFTVRGVPV